MNFIAFIKYVVRSASYGVLAAVILILIVPELRVKLANNSFLQGTEQTAAPLSYAKAVQAAGPAVVNIYSYDIKQNSRYGGRARQIKVLGSGVIMESAGYILTNYHVVQKCRLYRCTYCKVVFKSYSAELIGFDVVTDLAVLKVQANNLPVIPQRQ